WPMEPWVLLDIHPNAIAGTGMDVQASLQASPRYQRPGWMSRSASRSTLASPDAEVDVQTHSPKWMSRTRRGALIVVPRRIGAPLLADDEPRAAREGEVRPGPLQYHGQPVAKAAQPVDV